jgi:hypothetical protein
MIIDLYLRQVIYMENSTDRGFKVNQFEYGYLVEDTDPCARTMKVSCPKLNGMQSGSSGTSNEPVSKSAFANDSSSSLDSNSTVSGQEYITAKVTLELAHRHSFHDCDGCPCPNKVHSASTCHPGISCLKPCNHYHHDHHFPHLGETGMIPKGTKVILLFMDPAGNDAYVTRFWCEFPDGTTNGTPPRERGR